jgi:hypothetical protein
MVIILYLYLVVLWLVFSKSNSRNRASEPSRCSFAGLSSQHFLAPFNYLTSSGHATAFADNAERDRPYHLNPGVRRFPYALSAGAETKWSRPALKECLKAIYGLPIKPGPTD